MVHEYMPLVDIGCSKHLRFFLCSLYAPICSALDTPIPPCRTICLEVRQKCLPVLQKFNFSWPDALDCSGLPLREVSALCVEPPNITTPSFTQEPGAPFRPLYPFDTPPPLTPQETPKVACPPRQTWVAGRGGGVCSPICDQDVLFRRADKHFAEVWMLVWAGLCFVSTLFTVLTFWLEPARFRYPERPIICLSLCYLLYCLAYLSRLVVPLEVLSCEVSQSGVSHLAVEGLQSSGCIITFILQYYFGMASGIWWMVLTLTWFLSAGKKWSPEALQAYASYFHAAAWGLPAISTILILTLKQVDGDELVGLCYVGNVHQWAHMSFVVAPLSSVLAIGTLFIAFGFSIPSVEIFMLKVFMSLVVGITTGMWIWSSKTVLLWQKFFKGVCGHHQALRKKDGHIYHPPNQIVNIIKKTDGQHQNLQGSRMQQPLSQQSADLPQFPVRLQGPTTIHLSQV
ncbi:Frizzled-10-like [Homarus americanus]|uniref:Frizzled-10-like n=1 Tax=Homarus americanus TaxID=6706 RepID=A0A8J5N535_HOMAM|nr:Frizzled-10-like [Homarus americanus]